MRRIALIATALLSITGLLWWSAVHSNQRAEPPAQPYDATPTPSEGRAAPADTEPQPAPTAAPSPSVRPTAPSPDPSEPEAPSQAPPGKPLPTPPPPPQPFGPLAVLDQRFRSEPRDSGAPKLEHTIENAFKAKNVPRELLKSAQCRKSVCKLALRWSAERAEAYLFALMNLRTEFGPEMAIQPIGQPDTKGVLAVDVYWGRTEARTP